jgi:tetratricopeptide (TPR) repeat protein
LLSRAFFPELKRASERFAEAKFRPPPRLACVGQKSDAPKRWPRRPNQARAGWTPHVSVTFQDSKFVQPNLPSSDFSTRLARRMRAILCAAAVGAVCGADAAQAARPTDREFDVSSIDGAYLAGLVAGAERDTGAASAFLTEALKADPKNSELMERAFVAELSNGDFENAFTVARALIAHDKTNGLAQLVLGVRDLGKGRYSSARDHFAKGGAKTDITSDLLVAWSWAGAGDTKRAVAAVESFNQPRFQVFRDYHEGLIDDLGGKRDDARAHLKAAYDGDPQTLRIVDAWARFSARNGDVATATAAYKSLLDLAPRQPIAQSALADLAADKKLDPAVRSAQGGAAEVLYGLGAAGVEGADDLPAMIYIRLALYLSPHDDLASITLADLYERLKQHQQAIDVYHTIQTSSPMRLDANIQIANIEDELGQHQDAIQALQNVVSGHPDNVDALTALGNLERVQKDYVDAQAVYAKALDKSGGASVKSNWALLYFRGICEERRNVWPPAEADFKQALALFPDQPLVLNYLGYSWVDRRLDLDEAFKMLQKAAELRPDDGFIVDSLGWAYYQLGNYQQAEKVLERAVELEPSDSTVNEHLGDAYWRNGRKLEAHFQWNHARDFGPDKEDLPRILNEIAHGLPDPAPQPPAAAATPSAPAKQGG